MVTVGTATGLPHCGQRSRQRTKAIPGLAAALGPWVLLTETPQSLSLSQQQLNQLALAGALPVPWDLLHSTLSLIYSHIGHLCIVF